MKYSGPQQSSTGKNESNIKYKRRVNVKKYITHNDYAKDYSHNSLFALGHLKLHLVIKHL